jgi:alkylhydroperoxidase family enzyme
MAQRIPPTTLADRDERTEELLAAMRRPDGSNLNIFATLAHHPRLLKRWPAFGGTLLFRGQLPARDRELLILRTAWLCKAESEWVNTLTKEG